MGRPLLGVCALMVCGCNVELWEPSGPPAFVDPDDPDTVQSEAFTDEGTATANGRGWYLNGTHSLSIPPLNQAWTHMTYDLSVRIVPGSADVGPFTFSWQHSGMPAPRIENDARSTRFGYKVHDCEYNMATLTVTASDASFLVHQYVDDEIDSAGCNSKCGGSVDACPYCKPRNDGGGECQDVVDQITAGTTSNACVDACIASLVTCLEQNDCDFSPCTAGWGSCTQGCVP